MKRAVNVDLEVLAKIDNEYLVRISKAALNSLVTYENKLKIRHWDGEKPVVLEPYGNDAVRTREDASDANNLDNLPQVSFEELESYLRVVS